MNYKISENGTAYPAGTDKKVIRILDNAMKNREKLRIWYGDKNTGKDWMEVCDVFGFIGRSGGTYKIPVLLRTGRSISGPALLPDSIVKITADKKVVYQHPLYNQPEFKIVDFSRIAHSNEYVYSVYAGDACIRNCKTRKQAENEIAFHKGQRNVA